MVFREIGCSFIEGKSRFTQLEISKKLGLSLSIVNGALKNLSEINAVKIMPKGFEIVAFDRMLLYWATHRNLKKDIIYSTRAEAKVTDIEKSMPSGIAFTGYTAYKFLFEEVPADYSEVYLYATTEALEEIKTRFAQNSKRPNVFVLKCAADMENPIIHKRLKKMCVCGAQLFADLWNMEEWYAKDFADALYARLIK